MNRVKRERIAFCTFVFTTFFTNSSPYSIHPQRLSTTRRRESDPAEDTKSGGSDPAFSAFSRPKSSWGRSRPLLPCGTRASLDSARQPRSLSPRRQVRVKLASPPNFSIATSPTTSPSAEQKRSEIIQTNVPKEEIARDPVRA